MFAKRFSGGESGGGFMKRDDNPEHGTGIHDRVRRTWDAKNIVAGVVAVLFLLLVVVVSVRTSYWIAPNGTWGDGYLNRLIAELLASPWMLVVALYAATQVFRLVHSRLR